MIKAICQRMTAACAAVCAVICVAGCSSPDTRYPSVRSERRSIERGNERYAEKDYEGALEEYNNALKGNYSSPEGLFNAACARMRISEGLVSSDKGLSDSIAAQAEQGFMLVSTMRDRASGLAAAALYNLGNREFRAGEYQKAIAYYIQALRINPDFNEARRNLRIAQLKEQENKDQDKDKDKDKDKDQNKDQNKDQDKDQNKDQDKDKDKDKQQQQQPERLPQQSADRILQANQRQEEATRARLQMRSKQRKEAGQPVSRKKW